MSLFAILGYIVVLLLICISLNGFHCFYYFVDFPSLLFIIAFLFLTLCGMGIMKDFVNGIKIGLRLKKSYSMLELKKAEESLQLIMKSLLLFASIFFLMSFVSMLHTMSLNQVGPLIATGLHCILYALIVSLFLTPFKGRIHILLIAYAEENSCKEEALNEDLLEQRIFYLFRSKGLTDREAEIARLITQGMTNREIAGKLYISEATVKKHITHILEKLSLNGRESIIDLIQKNS